jgi:putative copper resistance protein D
MSARTVQAPASRRGRTSRDPQLALVAIGACALAALIGALVLGEGRPTPAPPGIPDPGPITGWGLPISTLITNVGLVGAIGAVLVGVLLAPAEQAKRGRPVELSGVGLRCLRHASRWAAVWLVGALGGLVFGLSDLAATPVSSLTPALMRNYLAVSLGQAQLASIALALFVAVGARSIMTLSGGAFLLVCAFGGLVPPALTGHSASAGNHDIATSSLFVHLVAASSWVGGLAAIVLVARKSRRFLAGMLPRFSTLALWCYIAVGVSGAINAWVRLGDPHQLWSSRYGWLVIGKTAALVLLGVFGYRHRRRYVGAITAQRAAPGFVGFVVGEAAVMAATIGLATALSRTPTPVQSLSTPSPAEALLGYPVPRLTLGRLVFGGRPDILVLGVVCAAAVVYFGGVSRLRRRGDAWPVGRSVAFGAGLAVVAYVLCGGLAVYGQAMFSAHMVQHMVLTMAAPILLGLGSPITLALRALPARGQGGSRGAREWLLVVVHSKVSWFLTHPLVALTLYVATLYGFYFTPAFQWSMSHHSGHILMHAHFLAIGMLFFWVVLGADPTPRRLPHPARIGLLFASMPFHAFFGVAIMMSSTVLANGWFSALRLPWLHSLLSDQRTGGGIAWAFGEIPTVAVLAAIFVQWYRSEERENARRARHADAEDAELAAYNAELARLHRNTRE